jgi:G3E family GTPase
VCCSIRDDLKTALLRLEERRLAGAVPDYSRVMIETTGAADPAAAAQAIAAQLPR